MSTPTTTTQTRPAQLVLVTAVLVLLAYSTHLSSTLVAILQAFILVMVFSYFLLLGRRYPMLWRSGWSYIVIGVNLVTFSGLVDISEHIPFLRSALTTSHSPFRIFIGQVVGKMVGSVLLAYGFYRWVPSFLESRAVLEQMAHDMELQLRTQTEALREAQEFLRLQSLNRAIVDTVPLGLLATDAQGVILSSNVALSELTGIEPAGIVGQRLDQLFQDSTLGPRLTEMSGQDRFGLQVSELVGVPLPRGTRDLRLVTARSGEGPLVCVLEDVTDRNAAAHTEKLLQEQLVKNEKLSSLGSLVSGVAHELNNPLSIILGYTDVLTAGTPTAATLSRALLAMQNASIRCQKIVTNLLSFGRQQAPHRTLVHVPDLLKQALELRSTQFKARSITVKQEFDWVPRTMADGHQLLQVFFNLINNSYQALAEHDGVRELRVGASERSGVIRVVVSDTGPGIPREIRSKVFDPFFTTKEVGVGTGLGLSICYGILQAHGGDIRLETQDGMGTRFTCEIPITIAPAVGLESLSQVADREKLAGKRILVVDDELDIVEFCRAHLSKYQLHIEHCNHGARALEMLCANVYDLVLLDLRLPGLSGREVYETLRQRHPGRAEVVTFMTGDTADESTVEFLRASERRYFFKPFRTSTLDELLTSHLVGQDGPPLRPGGLAPDSL